MTTPVDEVIAERVKHYRQCQKWTVRQLAERCATLIPGLTEASVTNIERARREVSARELLILAHVLQVPPVALLLPLANPRAAVEIVPGVESPIEQALAWLTATAPEGMDGREPADLGAWYAISHLRRVIGRCWG